MRKVTYPLLIALFLLAFDGVAWTERQLAFPPDRDDGEHWVDFAGEANLSPSDENRSADSWNVALIGRLADGPCFAVATQGQIAYFGNGAYLEIVDLLSMTKLGKVFLKGSAQDVVARNDFAYVADGLGLRIIDASNPTAPVEVGFFDTDSLAVGVAVSGDYAYVAANDGGLRVIDVSDPSAPFEVGSLATDGFFSGITVAGSLAYVAAYVDGLRIIDISDPTSPFEVGFFDTAGQAEDVAVSGDFAYVADYSNGLRIIDVSNPSVPVEAGFVYTDNQVEDVVVTEDYAYFIDDWDGLRILDIYNPTRPVVVGSLDTGDWAVGIALGGDYVCIADLWDGLHVVDVSSHATPIELGAFDTGGTALDVAVAGRYVYAATGFDGLWVIDVSDPAAPFRAGVFDTSTHTQDGARGIAVSGSYAYVADFRDGLRVIDISDPTAPFEVGFFDTGGIAVAVAASGDYAYVADARQGLWIVDVSDPTSPLAASVLDPSGGAVDVDVSGDYAYVVGQGFAVIDVSNPAAPFQAGSLDLIGEDVAVRGNYAYVTYPFEPVAPPPGQHRGRKVSNTEGLRVIDISDPTLPFEAGFFETAGKASDVAVSGDYAYVADYGSGLRIIDVSDPAELFEAGFFDTDGAALGVAVDGDQLYVADAWCGVWILRNDIPVPVYLSYFVAEREGWQAKLRWEVSHERDHAGFHLFRQVGTGARERLNQALLAGHTAYEFIDAAPPLGEVTYWLQGIGQDGAPVWLGSALLRGVDTNILVPHLIPNYPNPFNPHTTVRYDLPTSTRVSLSIYDALGRFVITIVDKDVVAGRHSVVWDGRDSAGSAVPSGAYFMKLSTSSAVDVQRLMLVR
jgi:hypothetical protein